MGAIMRHVWIRIRPDGVTELSPELAPLERDDRRVVTFTLMIVTLGFFMAGFIPPAVVPTVAISCLAGEMILGAKALVLAVLRPPAEVLEVARWQGRRRA